MCLHFQHQHQHQHQYQHQHRINNEHPPRYNSLWALQFKNIWRWTLPLHSSLASSHRYEQESQIVTHHCYTGYDNLDIIPTQTHIHKCMYIFATIHQFMSTCVETQMTINTSTLLVQWKITAPRRSVSKFDTSPYNRVCQYRYWHRQILDNASMRHRITDDEPLHWEGIRGTTLALGLLHGSQYRHGELSPLSRPTAQSIIGTERQCTIINETPAGWSSSYDTVLQFNTDHDTMELCINCVGAVEWKSSQLMPAAQLTTELRNRHMIDASNGMRGGMVISEELRAWHGLALVFCLLFVFGLSFNGLVFDRCDNALEEC